ncbi:succinate dehydrogenase/fumarate reductase iron-sulfur subunit [Arcobacter sp. CECT 8983]|uniref:fumarate reductase iron-sulfur subunit n=1 Tax=Arcobacter sp. CECT 8983 TaxID=2044508 RepID=UPI00100AE09C|nr:fumarate reductase iron-sulfur subunit [Arcobacter sp. CECT 8983]RXJ88594.1 succinate dehydrogenase/fumarate reductase iron-sulfur subunit [Arcobacter sp. CECT 8983]
MARELTIKVLRYDPQNKDSIRTHIEEYKIQEADSMTIYLALTQIRETMDAGLSFDFVCRAGICGSCAMMINGRPKLACRTLTKDLPDEIILLPLPTFKLIKDLSVNTGVWMDEMSKRVESWIHTSKETDIAQIEEPIEPEVADAVFELDRCIECGCCVAGCGTKLIKEDFVGAVGLNRVARFECDPHDERTADDYYELVGDDNGIFGCMTLLGCEDTCPKHLPLQNKIAYMRRKLATVQGS